MAGDDIARRWRNTTCRRNRRRRRASRTFAARAPTEHDYFFANLTGKAFDGWLQLGTPGESAMILDPLSGRAGAAAVKRAGERKLQVYLQLASGESTLVRTWRTQGPRRGTTLALLEARAEGVALAGEWSLEFIKGGPTLPGPARMSTLASWTSLDDPEAKRFAGTARYRLEFDAPASTADAWELDLGDVRETARVTLNGKRLATAWSLPFRVRLDGSSRAATCSRSKSPTCRRTASAISTCARCRGRSCAKSTSST